MVSVRVGDSIAGAARATARRIGAKYYDGQLHKCGNTLRFASNKRCVHCEPEYKRHVKFGLTTAAFDALDRHQSSKCAICHLVWVEVGTPVVDHDHVTKQVRGLLCHKCNRGLGMFLDSPQALRAAAEYLEKDGV